MSSVCYRGGTVIPTTNEDEMSNAKEQFNLSIISGDESRTLIGDGSERFFVSTASLDEEVSDAEPSTYDAWTIRATAGVSQDA